MSDDLVQSGGGVLSIGGKRGNLTAGAARSAMGLDAAATVSDAVRAALGNPVGDGLAAKAPIDSPAFTGTASFASPPRITTASVDQKGVVNVDSVFPEPDATGGSDAHTAFQVCLDLANTLARPVTILMPGGRYRLDGQIAGALEKNLTLDGGGSTLIQNHNNNLFILSSDPGLPAQCQLRVRDVDVLNLGSANTAFVFQFLTNAVVERVTGKVASGSSFWAAFFNVAGMASASWRDIVVTNGFGAITSLADFRGILFAAGLTCLNHVFDGVQGNGWNTGFDLETSTVPGIEGMFFNNCVLPGVRRGVTLSNTGYIAPGGLRWTGGHVEAHEYCFDVNNCAQVKISDALLYRNTQYGQTGRHIRLGNCIESSVVNNDLLQVNSGSMGGVPAVEIDSGSYHRVLGNFIAVTSDVATAIVSSATSTDVYDNTMIGSGLTGTGMSVTGSGGNAVNNRIAP